MTNTALAEHTSSAAPAHLDRARAGKLLRECGYDLVELFDHVHATRDTQEWHLCLVTDLASMPPVRLLACLEEALTLRVEPSIVFSSHA